MTSEHTEQQAVFEWASLMSNRYPELQLLFAIPNAGKRSYGAAAHMKAEGLRSGLPDLCLPIPRFRELPGHGDTNYGALYIEMKRPGNKPKGNQLNWIGRLCAACNKVIVCYSADEAISVIKDYLGISDD